MKPTLLFFALAFVVSAAAQTGEPTVLFYEPFSTQYEEHAVLDMTTDTELKANTILGTDAYKVDGNYYFNDEDDKIKLINFDILDVWKEAELWPDASKGGIGYLYMTDQNERTNSFSTSAYRIKLTTKDFQQAYFSAAHSTSWFVGAKFSYSFDFDNTWHEFSKTDAVKDEYESNWRRYLFKENIGGQDVVYLKIEDENGSPYYDDFKVTGYGPIGVEGVEATLFSAYRQGEGIVVRGVPEGETIAVYNSAGIEVATAAANESETCIQLQTKGLYIIKAGNKAVKAMW